MCASSPRKSIAIEHEGRDEAERAVDRVPVEDDDERATPIVSSRHHEEEERAHAAAPARARMRGGQHDVRERERQEPLPAERHELVVAEARQRPADDDLEERAARSSFDREGHDLEHATTIDGSARATAHGMQSSGRATAPASRRRRSVVTSAATSTTSTKSAIMNIRCFAPEYSVK